MNPSLYKAFARSLVVAFFMALFWSKGYCAIIFYGGDADGRNRLESSANPELVPISIVFDDFQVAQATTVTGLWGNYSSGGSSFAGFGFDAGDVLDAYFEIRSGVSEGNGGTLEKFGKLKLTASATGRYFDSNPELRLAGDLAVEDQFLLGSGTYWIGLAPANSSALLVSTTSGTNLGPDGDPNPLPTGFPLANGNSFLKSEDYDFVGVNSQELLGDGVWDFSYGLEGVAVPEPGTFVAGLLLALPIGAQAIRYLRNRNRA